MISLEYNNLEIQISYTFISEVTNRFALYLFRLKEKQITFFQISIFCVQNTFISYLQTGQVSVCYQTRFVPK